MVSGAVLSSSSSWPSPFFAWQPPRRRRCNPPLKTPNPPPPTRLLTFIPRARRPSITSSGSRSKWNSQDFWEAPDAGYGSEFDDDEDEDDEEEEEIDESSSSNAAGTDSSLGFEKLVEEVELLLSPEERAILQENETPVLSKISTKKWSLFHTLGLSIQIHLMDNVLELGVDIDSVDKDGFTALHKAVIGKKEAVISHLLRKGANPHVRDKDGASPLHYAVQVGAMQTVKLLIKYKVDVNVEDKDGWTPLHVAIQSRSRDIAKVLLVNGADKTRKNKDGKTALDLALCYGKDFKSYDLAKLLKLVPANRDLLAASTQEK